MVYFNLIHLAINNFHLKTILKTDRLRLREFTLDDTSFVLKLVNTPSWIEFIGDKNIRTHGVAEEYILNNLQESYEVNGFGLWLMELKGTQTPIGMCGLVNRDTLDDIDIGFALLPEYERKGYTYEAAKATLQYAKDILNIDKVVAITTKANNASIALLEKLGLQFEKELVSKSETLLLFS